MSEQVRIMHGDSRALLKELADSSIDSCVTDPPYALVSITKRFGRVGSAPAQEGKDGLYRRASAGFMGQQWDTGETAFDPAFWLEVLRVLKPGAHLLAFSGTRTYHKMACAIEDAGFEIRDMVAWEYGTGFPKSHNLDDEFDGWGTALKPALEPICMARKPLSESSIVANMKRWRTGAININACRIEFESVANAATNPLYRRLNNYKDAGNDDSGSSNYSIKGKGEPSRAHDLGRWPANVVHDGSEEVIHGFPQSASSRSEITSKPGSVSVNGAGLPAHTGIYGFDYSGSAARFFYSAKADASDRLGSKHPTVKPVDLMQWLLRLVTPRNGLVLDPFAGSGTTGEAAIREGMRAILMERETSFIKDIERRISLALSGPVERQHQIIKAKIADGRLQDDPGPLFSGEVA